MFGWNVYPISVLWHGRGNFRERTDIIANGHAITKILSDDDVVPVEQLEANVAMTPLPGVANHGVISQQHDKIYVQTNCES